MVDFTEVVELEMPYPIKCDGTSIWMDTEGVEGEVRKVEIRGVDDEEMDMKWVLIDVYHTVPDWEIYTDGGIERDVSRLISDIVGERIDVTFTEQGMQDHGMASLEPYSNYDRDVVLEWLKPL